ncbi:MAG TPA: DUF4279 domain-containing protein [Paenibacillus sp.]|uniref:DUF4279 domain-containing protein n=1 Tax=Paenibacillus TaxID=44249 RepID=UPI000BA10E76|nr:MULTISPECIES: DUF4279 domain-containing protein [Paenibacillus]OZQ68128.1 hypothetical protein CA599_16035 [Paenibacillus taichungensis]HBU84372.1 DUF4279 domain-containing protein [Paenibacillus sp.]
MLGEIHTLILKEVKPLKDKTEVMAYFSLLGDEFDPNYVTSILKIEPTNTAYKGDIINKKHRIKETSWTLGTDYEESLDINHQLTKVVDLLRNKVKEINSIRNENRLSTKFFIVIRIEEGKTPALYLNSDFIEFVNMIHAEIDVDLYANPYNEELE